MRPSVLRVAVPFLPPRGAIDVRLDVHVQGLLDRRAVRVYVVSQIAPFLLAAEAQLGQRRLHLVVATERPQLLDDLFIIILKTLFLNVDQPCQEQH